MVQTVLSGNITRPVWMLAKHPIRLTSGEQLS